MVTAPPDTGNVTPGRPDVAWTRGRPHHRITVRPFRWEGIQTCSRSVTVCPRSRLASKPDPNWAPWDAPHKINPNGTAELFHIDRAHAPGSTCRSARAPFGQGTASDTLLADVRSFSVKFQFRLIRLH